MNATHKQPTVMVVDDSPDNLTVLEKMLREQGYRVVAFPRGDLALKAAARKPPDLILLDIMMPGMDGFAVCERLKADATLKEIPVLFISGLSETRDKIAAFSAGGVDYVTKPFQPEEVCVRVETHLTLRRQRQDLQNAYDRLRELESQRDNLVHMIVHDMRSPLTVIAGNLELAQMSALPDDAAHCLADALSATMALVEMVGSILDVSKMEAGQMTLKLSAVDMRDLLSKTLQSVDPIKGQRTLALKAPEKMAAFPCDAHLIERVVQNLIHNALKFTDEKEGAVTVGVAVAEDTVRVTVSDNGPGISEAYREKIFDKFWQAPAGKQGQKRSTGLGLAFCKLAVEAHGGEIGVESREGKGSDFWFTLPASKADEPDRP